MLIVAFATTLLHLVGGGVAKAAIILSLFLAAYFTWTNKAKNLAPLLLLILPSAAFAKYGGFRGMVGYDSNPFESIESLVVIGGVQIGVPLVIVFVATIRVIQFYVRDFKYLHIAIKVGFIFWSVSLFLACLSSIHAAEQNINGWSKAIRCVMTISTFFWGRRILWKSGWSEATFNKGVEKILLVGAIMMIFGGLRGHLVFVFAGLCAAAIPILISKARFTHLAISLVALQLLLSTTFTIFGEIILAIALSFTQWSSKFTIAKRYGSYFTVALAFSLMALTAVVSYYGKADQIYGEKGIQIGLSEERQGALESKINSDRGELWRDAIEELRDRNIFIAPSGKGFYRPSVRKYWSFGAHNIFLEAPLNIGLAGGLLLVAVLLIALRQVHRRLVSGVRGYSIVILAGVESVIVVSLFTSNFLIYPTVGAVIWTLAGIATSPQRREKS